jgi:hypothetical protein
MPPKPTSKVRPDDLVRYSRPLDGKTLFVTSNLASVRRIMGGRYPVRVMAVAHVEAPDHEGLPLEDEALALDEAEDRFTGIFAGMTMSLIHTGRITYNGQRVLVAYSAMPNPLGVGPQFTLSDGGRYPWHVYYQDDSEYEFLRTVMTPTTDEMRRARNKSMLARLAQAGDDGTQPRTINCIATYYSNEGIVNAAALLAQNQFTTGDVEPQPDKSWYLSFSYACAADPDTIDQLTLYLMHACHECGGRFEGWECEPVR